LPVIAAINRKSDALPTSVIPDEPALLGILCCRLLGSRGLRRVGGHAAGSVHHLNGLVVMLAALVVSGQNRTGKQNTLGSFGLHGSLALKCGQTGGFAICLGAFLLLERLESSEGVTTGGVGRCGFAFGLLSPEAGLALGGIAFGAKPGQFLCGTLGLGFGAASDCLRLGLFRAQLGEHAGGLCRLHAGLLGGEPMSFRLSFGALAIFRLTPGEVSSFDFGPLCGECIFGPRSVGAITKNRGNQEQDGKDGDNDVLVHFMG
jgi:hypothetical protein